MDPKSLYVCSKCGKSTWEVDMDYLVGYDHLTCFLLDDKQVKLENWEKLDGQLFSVIGVDLEMTNPDVDYENNRYTIWVNELVQTKSSLMRVDLYLNDMEIDIKTFVPDTFATPPHHTNKKITKDHIKNPSIFIQVIGGMMMSDKLVRSVLDFYAELSKVTTARGGMSGGIVNTVLNSGNTVTFGSASLW